MVMLIVLNAIIHNMVVSSQHSNSISTSIHFHKLLSLYFKLHLDYCTFLFTASAVEVCNIFIAAKNKAVIL